MWYIILSLIISIYLLTNLVVPRVFGGIIGSYVITPFLWISLAIVSFFIAQQEGLNIWSFKKIRKWEIGRNPFEAALLIGGFQVSLLIIAGLFVGFGKSPYAHTLLGIIINLIYILSILFGVELSRAYLVKKGTTSRRNITLTLGIVAVLFMFIKIAPGNFAVLDFSNPAASVKFIGETIIPLLAMGLFASYLAYVGGALPAIGYMGVLQGFEWFAPVLPDLDWALTALIGTLAPATGFLIIQNSIELTQPGARKSRRKAKTKDPALSWTGVAALSLLLVFFSFGYFGVQPTVIYSGSMQPDIGVGDVVIISKVPADTIKVGDIVQYRSTNISIPIVHRVHEIYNEQNTKLFITKGDANNEPDMDPVTPEQIMGKSVFVIPKIGWIPITVKSLIREIVFNL